jgi:hypothetical protein
MFVLVLVHVNSFSINRVRYALNPYVAILYSGLIKKYTCLFYDVHFGTPQILRTTTRKTLQRR